LEACGDDVDTAAEAACGQLARCDEPIRGSATNPQQASCPRYREKKWQIFKVVVMQHNSSLLAWTY
jgi:hypothetical protein